MNDSFDASLSKSNTFFDETFEKDLFASFSGGDHHGSGVDAMAITPSTGTPSSANSFFGDDLMSTSMSLSSSMASRFNKTKDSNRPSAQHQQQQQVNKLLHTSSSKIVKAGEVPKMTNGVSPKFGKRKGLNAAGKKKNKFKPTNLVLALGETKPKAYNAGLDDNPFGDQDEAPMSQLGYEITSSGQFNVEGLKIGANGISDLPIMTQSQSQSQSAFSMSLNCDSPVKTFNMLNFNSPPQQTRLQQPRSSAPNVPSTSASLTFDSPPPKRKQSDLKKRRYLPYSSPDDTLDDYIVIKKLGEGASSTVSLVKNKKTNLMYAQKVITTTSKAQPKLILSEVQSLVKCKACPYIIQLHQAFYKNDKIHILLEYMDGNSLQELLKVAKQIPENILKLVAVQVLKGLLFLHTKSKIVHRDIKPANILIKKNGQVKISDFGLTGIYSRRKHGSEQNFGNGQHYGVNNPLVFGTCQGTVLYMSPERIREEKHSFNSDIWSVGITLAELCTGAFPFKSVQYFDVLDEISNMKELPLDKKLCSEQFCKFVNACVQIDPNKRPTTSELLNHEWIRDVAHKDDSSICSEVQQWLNSFPDL